MVWVVMVWVVIAVVRVPGSITYMVTSVQDLRQQLQLHADEVRLFWGGGGGFD